MPTITPHNLTATAAHGNNVGVTKRGRGYEDGSSSSSGSDSGGSSSGSASDSDEVVFGHILMKLICCICGVYMCIPTCEPPVGY